MRYLAAILLLLALVAPVTATDLDDLNPSLPADSYDVSTHAAYIRALHLAVRTFGMSEHNGAGLHSIPMGTVAEMNAATKVNGRLWFATDVPARLYVYRESSDTWIPATAYDATAQVTPMYAEDYDPNDYGDRVEYADNLHDGTYTVSSTTVYNHTQMTDGTDNPHGLEADNIDFTGGANTIEDIVTAGAATGAALIPLGTSGSNVDEIVSSSSGDGAALIPFTAGASTLSGAAALDLLDTVDGGYDVILELKDVAFGADGPWIDARTEGATGDGTTDDAAAIQAAIDAMTSGGVVFFPEGDYLVKTTLEVDVANVWLVGAGEGRTTITRHSDIGDGDAAITYNNNLGGFGLANLTVTGVADTDGVGVSVGNASESAQIHMQNVTIDGDDELIVGLELNYAIDSTFRDVEILSCDEGMILTSDTTDALANRNLLFDRLEVEACADVGLAQGAVVIRWGDEITFRDCHIHDNDGRAVYAYLTASSNTRTMNFYGCTFRDNLLGAITNTYQVGVVSATNRPYAWVNFDGCSFVDAVDNSYTNEHLQINDYFNASVMNCYFDAPGPGDDRLRVIGNIDAGCRLVTNTYYRGAWTVATTGHVSGSGDGFTVNGYGQSESLVHTLASGTPSAIDGVVGDRVYVTGGNVDMGEPLGWICETSGDYGVLDTGAHCSTTDTSPTFTVDTTYLPSPIVEIGARLAFTSDAVWSVTYPTVIDVSVSGTTASITMNSNAGSTNATDTAVGQEPVWKPIAELPIYHEEDDPDPGDITAGSTVTGTFTVTGAAEGDFVTGAVEWADCSADADEAIICWYAATDTVGYLIQNITGSTISLDNADFRVVVRKQGTTVP